MRTSFERLTFSLILALWMLGGGTMANSQPSIVPPPKQTNWSGETIELGEVRIHLSANVSRGNYELLTRILRGAGLTIGDDGIPLSLSVGDAEIPDGSSSYFDRIRPQGYRIDISGEGIAITGNDEEGLYYALQTFDQLLDGTEVPVGGIVDWPDLPIRMIMVDPARQNENMDYYRRVIEFAGRYKINAILCHLTDDQTSALYHEDYPELMHHRAWKPEEIADLRALAREHHIELIPEIESLGHSRMFERRPNFQDYLHQTEDDTPDESWMGTDIPGYTNVLCPGSDHALEYLDKMFQRAAETFEHPWIHIGFDEVDITRCARCIEAFGEQTPDEWMTKAFELASERVARHAGKTALWGDMLLSHPGVADNIPPGNTIIFDWYYRPDVDADSVRFFKERGFEVIASPALACAPHMIIPNRRNYDNITRFTEIARDEDLLGVNTTIWVPVRYMSDALWTGIAFAAAHAWGGSNFDEAAFFDGFTRDYFQSNEGGAYRAAWNRLNDILWHRPDIYTACWINESSLQAARRAAEQRGDEVRASIRELGEIRRELARIGQTVNARRTEWRVTEKSVAIIQYTMEHLLASLEIEDNPELVANLDARCVELIRAIEADWDRNRFADDPGKDGRFLQNQHLLFRFRQMHAFHQELLEEEATGREDLPSLE